MNTIDVIENSKLIRVGNNGHVELIDCMPRIVDPEMMGDKAIVDAARVSYKGCKTTNSDKGLINYLLRHDHTTPFEMVVFKFRVKMPIYIARQHMRHRTASINEMSARYTELPTDVYVPEFIGEQSSTNNQGSGEPITSLEPRDLFEKNVHASDKFEDYHKLIQLGVAKETARMIYH